MPQADANAFKVLKRNHALLNRRSRAAFDPYKKDKRISPVGQKVKVVLLTKVQRQKIDRKITAYKQQELRGLIVRLALTLMVISGIVYLLYW